MSFRQSREANVPSRSRSLLIALLVSIPLIAGGCSMPSSAPARVAGVEHVLRELDTLLPESSSIEVAKSQYERIAFVRTLLHLQAYELDLAEALDVMGCVEANRMGATGKGISVAVPDVFGWPHSIDSHGAKVAAIIKACAPDVDIVPYDMGDGPTIDKRVVLKTLEQVLLDARNGRISVMNISWGNDITDEPCTTEKTRPIDPAWKYIELIVKEGVLIAAAAGNDGFSHGVISPGCVPGVLSVGSVWDREGEIDRWCGKAALSRKLGITCYTNYHERIVNGELLIGPVWY